MSTSEEDSDRELLVSSPKRRKFTTKQFSAHYTTGMKGVGEAYSSRILQAANA